MFGQTLQITLMNLSSIRYRLGTSSVIVLGIAGVVAVLVGLLALSYGFQETVRNTAREDRGLVMRRGSVSEWLSYVPHNTITMLQDLDEVVLASGEFLRRTQLIDKQSLTKHSGTLRSMDADGLRLRPEIKLSHGRMFEPGKFEVIVGRRLVETFQRLEIGDAIVDYNGELEIVGHFESSGSALESEILTDLATAHSFYKTRMVNVVRVRLADTSQEPELRETLKNDPRGNTEVRMEKELYAEGAKERATVIESFAYWLVGIMALGAFTAALSTMYSAIQARTVEFAILRAIGFSTVPLVTSILVEGMLLATLGAMIGGGVIWLTVDGLQTVTNDINYALVSFNLSVTGQAIWAGIGLGLLLGFLGALFAAIRAIRLPVTSGLVPL